MKNQKENKPLKLSEIIDDFIEEYVITGLKQGAKRQKVKLLEDLIASFCDQFSDTLCVFDISVPDDVFDAFRDRVE